MPEREDDANVSIAAQDLLDEEISLEADDAEGDWDDALAPWDPEERKADRASRDDLEEAELEAAAESATLQFL